MIVQETNIKGVFVIKPKVFGDDRGYFFESFNHKLFTEATGFNGAFVQDNQSKSSKGVLRGLHFQAPPMAQGKLVRVVSGSVLDVAVDIRPQSKTYGEHFSIVLDTKSFEMLWVPPGMAHGFLSLEDNTVFSYKCTNYYAPETEMSLLWSDKDLAIDWGVDNPSLSEKDKNGVTFSNFNSPF